MPITNENFGNADAPKPESKAERDRRDRDDADRLEDGSSKDGAAEVPSDEDRGDGVSVNAAR